MRAEICEPWVVPTNTGNRRLSHSWKTRVQDLSERKVET